MKRFAFLLLFLLSVEASEFGFNDDDSLKYFEIDPNESLAQLEPIRMTPNSHGSSLDCPSTPELKKKFVVCDDQRYRPRGPSIHLTNTPTQSARKHVSFGWVQFSDDRMMPSEDMLDTSENREHIRVLMLADARHGNLEYFRYLVRVLERLYLKSGEWETTDIRNELCMHNPDSMIFAAIQSDNVEIFTEVMAFKGISVNDMNPFYKPNKDEDKFSPHSYPPKRRILLDESLSSDDDDDLELEKIEETVLGQAIIQNSIEIVRYLLDNGIKDEYPDGTESALHLAIEHGHEIIVRYLLETGSCRIDRENSAFRTALIVAILQGNPRVVKLLIDRGASLMAHDHEHMNILHHAAMIGNMEILTILKESLNRLHISERVALISSMDSRKRMPFKCACNDLVYNFMLNLNDYEEDDK